MSKKKRVVFDFGAGHPNAKGPDEAPLSPVCRPVASALDYGEQFAPRPSKPEPAGLDYEIEVNDHGEYEVWTPDNASISGAILGSGKTEQEAKADAVRNMEALCEVLIGARAKKEAR